MRLGGDAAARQGLLPSSEELRRLHDRAELGYWVGRPYWGRGYATEAGLGLLAHSFGVLRLNRVFAIHYSRNPASGRVLQKLGMRQEGVMPQHIKKWGVYVDAVCYGVLRDDWLREHAPAAP